MRTGQVLRIVIVFAAACLALAYLPAGYPLPALLVVIAGGLWLLLLTRRPVLVGTFGLYAFFTGAAAGAWLGLSLPLLFGGSVLTLIAWDLSEFSVRLRAIKADDSRWGVESGHFRRLGVLTILSALLGLAALGLQVTFTFEFGFVLVLLGVLGLSMLVARLKQDA